MKENRELLQYLEKNNIIISPKNMKLLAKADNIAKQYFGLFTLSSKIINFILVNHVFINDTVYNFMMGLSREYDEDTVIAYLKLLVNEPMILMTYATDNRIPKITENQNYFKLLKDKVAKDNLDIAYQALSCRFFRSSYYLDQIKKMAKDSFYKKVLTNEIAIIKEAQEAEKVKIDTKLQQILPHMSMDNGLALKTLANTFIYYDDYLDANYFFNLADLEANLDIAHIINRVRNADEFNLIVSIAMLILKLRNTDITLDDDFLDMMDMIKSHIAKSLNDTQKWAQNHCNLNVYFLVEELNQIFIQVIEQASILAKKKQD